LLLFLFKFILNKVLQR